MADKKWTEKLRSSMADYESSPPEGLWEAVESGLAGRGGAFRWNRVWAGAGIAAAVAAVAALVLLVWHPGGSGNAPALVAERNGTAAELAAPDTATDAAPELSTADVEESALQAETAPAAPVATFARHPERIAAVAPEAAPAVEAEADAMPEEAAAEPVAEEDATDAVPDQAPAEEPAATPSEEPAVAPAEESAPTVPGPGRSVEKPQGTSVPLNRGKRTRVNSRMKISAGLIADNVPSGSVTNSFQEVGMPMMFDVSTKAGTKMPSASMLARNKVTQNSIKHEVSASVGLVLHMSITEQWGIEGGVQRTVLRSHGTSTSGSVSSVLNTTTNYTGYPLLAVFTPWRGEHLSVYASAGPMLEHATRSRWNSKSSVGDYEISRDSGTDYLSDWILSMSANVGVQWEIDGWGALFLQPGFRWRFPGEGSPDSYFKDRPQTFNLGAGFRVSF